LHILSVAVLMWTLIDDRTTGYNGCVLLIAGEGEILTRGPHVMLGYWGSTDTSACSILPGGWLRTGDIGESTVFVIPSFMSGQPAKHGRRLVVHRFFISTVLVMHWIIDALTLSQVDAVFKSAGWLDETQMLWLLGRLKDVIRSGGENVHATEVEAVLLEHPAVVAAAVVSIKHQRFGEQV
jgi:acyl-CoA synthetase (AMP-forming)/AMP-acid ligase II